MYIYYDTKTDYLEVLYSKVPNFGEVKKTGVIALLSENKGEIVGYGIENASSKLEKVDFFSEFEILSILIKMHRTKKGYTQKQMAEKMGIKLLPYQRLESGRNNPTLKTILKLKEILPELELSLVA